MKKTFLLSLALFMAHMAFAQLKFMQDVRLSDGDSIAINMAETRMVFSKVGGSRVAWGNRSEDAIYECESTLAEIVAASGGNLVTLKQYISPGVSLDFAVNPQHVRFIVPATNPDTVCTLILREKNQQIKIDGKYWETSRALTQTGTRKASAVLNFASTAAQTSTDLTVSVPGAVDGDPVAVGVPNAAALTNCLYTAWVSAANVVTVRFSNHSASAKDPASATFKISVIKD